MIYINGVRLEVIVAMLLYMVIAPPVAFYFGLRRRVIPDEARQALSKLDHEKLTLRQAYLSERKLLNADLRAVRRIAKAMDE